MTGGASRVADAEFLLIIALLFVAAATAYFLSKAVQHRKARAQCAQPGAVSIDEIAPAGCVLMVGIG